jgi:hypothetical protein
MDTAESLVEQMVAAGEWPAPELMEAIVARGEHAIGPLLEVVRREFGAWPEDAPLDHALGLLSLLPPSQATIPAVLPLFRRYDDVGELVEALPPLLLPFGLPMIEPMLEIARDASLRWYTRSVAGGIALDVTWGNPEQRSRVLAVLREMLSGYVERARTEQLGEQEVSMVSSLVVDLAESADPEARSLIDAAFAADLPDMLTEEDVRDCYQKGARAPRPEPNWMDLYRKHWQSHQDAERRKANPPPPPPPPVPLERKPPRPPLMPALKPAPPTPRRQIGRNDPCWCGSGKKYKNCHLRSDQG